MSETHDEAREAAAAAARQNRTRKLLLIAIVIFGVLGVFLQFRFADQREAAAEAAANRPEARARAAMKAADRATIDKDYRAAWTALQQASAAIDEAFAERPDAPDVRRGRLLVARRLAHMAEHPGVDAAAGPLFEEAERRAIVAFEAEPTAERARSDRLSTARERADHLMAKARVDDAARITRAAAEAVEETTETLPLAGPVLALLGETWLDAAKAHAAAGSKGDAISAAAKALERALAGRGADEDPLTAAARAYAAADAAIGVAEKVEDVEAAARFEVVAVRILRQRQGMQPDDVSIRRTLAARLVRLADHAERTEDFEAALERHTEAVELRRALVEQYPADETVLRDLVRGLNQLGAFYSARDRDEDALKMYAEASEKAKGLDAEGQRTRIIAMGNHAQLLGRFDRTKEARAVATEAYALAVERADAEKDDRQAAVDAARAGLRLARLLRAPPGADRDRAEKVARAARARLDALGALEGRAGEIDGALDALIRELR